MSNIGHFFVEAEPYIFQVLLIAINWSLAKCSCPSWSAHRDESALRSSLASLDDCNASLHWWLGFWTFLVALGVVLEVVFVVWEYLDELHDFRRGIIHAPERPQTLLFVLGLLGAGLVAAGVSGEFWKESQIATVETCIRKGNDSLFLLLSKEAGDAAASAKTAREEADAVKGIADEARADAKDALAKAQAAQRALARAEADAAKAQVAASKASNTADKAESHLAEVVKRANELTEQLKRLTTPRSLTSVPRVVASLKPYKGTEYLWAGVCSDVECIDLLKSIDAVLQQAEWKRLPSSGTFPAILVFPQKDDPSGITETFAVGIGITVEAPNSSELIAKQDILHAPRHVQAAAVLNSDLAANVYPPEKLDKTPARLINAGEGTSTTVRITIGRKSVP
jgi:hypothetical protein